jgi:hypothetical protein
MRQHRRDPLKKRPISTAILEPMLTLPAPHLRHLRLPTLKAPQHRHDHVYKRRQKNDDEQAHVDGDRQPVAVAPEALAEAVPPVEQDAADGVVVGVSLVGRRWEC